MKKLDVEINEKTEDLNQKEDEKDHVPRQSSQSSVPDLNIVADIKYLQDLFPP